MINIQKTFERLNADDIAVKVYCLRHQESWMNRDGHGDESSSLTPEGKQEAADLSAIVRAIEPIDVVVSGTLPRHEQTTEQMLVGTGYSGPVNKDPGLNAVFHGPLVEEEDKKKIEKKYNLSRFQPDRDGFHYVSVDGKPLSFNPEAEQIYPFGLYCSAFVDRQLRRLVFPSEHQLPSFEALRNSVAGFNKRLFKTVSEQNVGKPKTYLLLGSCSALAFLYEDALYHTTGENLIPRNGSKINHQSARLYPQLHNEIAILYATIPDILSFDSIFQSLFQSMQPNDDYSLKFLVKSDIPTFLAYAKSR